MRQALVLSGVVQAVALPPRAARAAGTLLHLEEPSATES
jgi:hypothetical protein